MTDNGTNSFLKVDKIVAGTRTNELSFSLVLGSRTAPVSTVGFGSSARTMWTTCMPNTSQATAIRSHDSAPTNSLGPYVITDAIFGAETPGSAGIVFNARDACGRIR